MNYYIRERIGPKQSLTKEGYLLCEEVPIARTGQMTYGPGEIPLTPGPDGVIYIDRFPEDVFRPETMASFNGKDVVDEHPEEDVRPDNWRWVTAGVVLNPRRGIAAQDDILLADLLIKDPRVIELVRNGKREVSCGYDADYIQATHPDGSPILGRGKQINILGNHVALVEAGRCGPRCAIGDSISKELNNMTWLEKLKAAFAGKDEAAFNAALADAPKETATHVHVHTSDKKEDEEEEEKTSKDKTMDAMAKDVKDIKDGLGAMDARLKKVEDAFEKEDDEDEEKKRRETEDNQKILGELEEEAPPGTGDGLAAKSKDSAYLADSWQEAVSLAEIITPGIQVPTFDQKASPIKTYDALCRFRRSVLDLAFAQPDTRGFMDSVTNGRDYKKYTCDGIRTMFRAVGVFKKNANNETARRAMDGSARTSGGGTITGGISTPSDLNKKMQEFYKN